MLDDDSLRDNLARVIVDVGLVKWVLHVDAGRVEVSEVHDRGEVEVALKVAGIVTPGQRDQLRDLAERVEGIAKTLLGLW